MRLIAALLALAASSEALKLRSKTPLKSRAVAKPESAALKDGWAGVLAFTRFNCAFPFCPTTALDVCTADEHYEAGRPYVIATLIPQTPTEQMGFYAYSDFDASTRLHYTLAARQDPTTNQPLNQLFTVSINATGTGGGLLNASIVNFPSTVQQSDITYFFTYKGAVYTAFSTGAVIGINPATGAIISQANVLTDPDMALTLAASFDPATGIFYSNVQRFSEGANSTEYFLVSYTPANANAKPTIIGPLPPAPGSAGPDGLRDDAAISQLVVHTPSNGTQLMEMRSSDYDPFLWMSWLNPVTGASQTMPLPDDWYLDWELDPQIFPGQWPGSLRRVWSYDPVNQLAWFKLYDECGGETDDCDENETIAYLEWVPPAYVDWYVAVEPIEPEMTQMLWVNSSSIQRA